MDFVSPARLKTLEAIARISNKEIIYFQLLFYNFYNGKNMKLTSCVSDPVRVCHIKKIVKKDREVYSAIHFHFHYHFISQTSQTVKGKSCCLKF